MRQMSAQVMSEPNEVLQAGEVYVFPASYAQKRMWFLDRLEPGSAAYHMPFALRLTGPLDVKALGQALDEVFHRHEALRTRFEEAADGEVNQVIHPPASLGLTLAELEPVEPGARTARVLDWCAREAARPFDLERDVLLRASLLRLEDEEHVLLLVLHHIISDGWSMAIFARELLEVYAEARAGRGSPLPEPELQYVDHSEWQREWMEEGGESQRQAEYWKRKLAGPLPVLELPVDRPRPPVQTLKGATLDFSLPPEVLAPLRELGQREGATLFMTLLAGFSALLHRYSGAPEVVIGTPVANRRRAEQEGLIGLFVNTLALRVSTAGNPGLRELVRRARAETLEAYVHQDIPFEKVVEELRLPRSLGVPPVFQVMLVLENQPAVPLALAGLRVTPLAIPTRTARLDLMLSLEETAGGLRGHVEYSTDLFDEATVRRMLAHYERVLRGAATPDMGIADLPLLDAEERARVLGEWSRGPEPGQEETTLPALVEAQARRTPDAVAVSAGDESLTYRELDRRANQLAHHLRRLGVGPESVVGLCAERSLELAVGMLGISKAGGAYLPLDPAYPEDRLAFMLKDSRVSVLVAQERVAGRIPSMGERRVLLDAHAEALAREPGEALESGLVPENLVYVIYTSGSTGRPKGVGVTHRGLARLVTGSTYAQLGAGERVLQFVSISFDVSAYELWGPLCNGGQVVMAPPGALSLEELGTLFQERKVSTLWLTAGLFHQMVEGNLEGLAGVRQLLAGGDAVSAHHMGRVRERFPDCALINGYGPTEVTVFACSHVVAPGEPVDGFPIGRPISGTEAHIVDARLRPVPVGVPGELLLGGPGVARGYLGRPELTAERFIPHPFSARPGARLYRTGDLARFRADGRIEYLGRLDRQVKVRGYRIELGEVEEVLRARPEVADAVVLALPDPSGDKRLSAFVVPRNEATPPSPSVLRVALRERLPEHMVPTSWTVVDALPLGPNGKVDRQRLVEAEAPRSAGVPSRFVPGTEEERVLAELWAQVLEVEVPGADADFFALGGHSLLATKLVSRLRETFRLQVPLKTVFEHPRLEQLAGWLRARAGEAPARLPPPLSRVERSTPPPMSFAQQRLWFLDQLETGSAFYNMAFALRLEGRLEASALSAALRGLVERHEVLRTRLVEVEGEPRQLIVPEAGVALEQVSLAEVSEAEREARALALARAWLERPFDLARGPLLRAHVCTLGAEQHVLVLSMHHAVSDGWSLRVLVRELGELYAAHLEGRPAALAPLPVQYADFAAWQRGWVESGALAGQLDYWRQQLGGELPVLELPRDRPRPQRQRYRGRTLGRQASGALREALLAASQGQGVTPFMWSLAAFKALLHRLTGQEELLVGTPISGRTHADVEGLLGCFVNTLVLRAAVPGALPFRELLARVKQVCLDAYAHQDIPFEHVVEAVQPVRSTQHTPLFQTMFIYNEPGGEPERFSSLRVEPLKVETGTSTFDLTLAVTDTGHGLELEAEYDTDLFNEEVVAQWLSVYETLLEAAVRAPELRVHELPVLDAEARQRICVEWNVTPDVFPTHTNLAALLAAQAARSPEAPALSFGTSLLTYRELEARARSVARALRARGVGPEVRVGVCAERSLEMVIAVLGVIHAGGAYVPLDATHPAERLQYMLEDSGARVLLAQRRLEERLPIMALERLWLDDVAGSEDTEPLALPALEPEHLAYVIYTSGSTGRPKGVMLAHREVCQRLAFGQAAYPLGEGSRVLQVASLGFDPSVLEIFHALSTGAQLVLLPPGGNRDPSVIARHVDEHRVTSMELVPSMLELMLDQPLFMSSPSLRRVFVGGEAIPLVLQERFLATLSVELVNTYGPTEATVDVVHWPCRMVPGMQSVPIGKPISRSSMYIVDAHLRPVPVGVPGELLIGGAYLARGYQGRPEVTAEKFVPDPFSVEPGARLYRTGDLVRYLPNGDIEFLGRTDHQVKLRGVRIELGEIESCLRAHPSIRDCVVVTHTFGPGDVRLVAYCAVRDALEGPAQAEWSESLRTHLAASLPAVMVPAALVPMPALPLNASGKVDRKQLRPPEATHLGPRTAAVAPRGPVEEALASIWKQLLSVEQVGVTDDFFALGGHSLLALRMMTRVQQTLGVKLPLDTLFETPTIEALARRIEAGRSAPEHSPLVLLREGGERPPLFWVHPVGGGVLCYEPLVRRLGRERAHYGLRSVGLQGVERPEELAELAREYVRCVCEVRPEGPILLAGWSLGGVLAFEMARQLEARGREVALLLALDAVPDSVSEVSEEWAAAELAGLVSAELGVSEDEARAMLAGKGQADEPLQHVLEELRRNLGALRRYRPGPYLGRMLLLEASEREASLEPALSDTWKAVVLGGVEHHQVAGDHYQLVREPHVDAVAEHFRRALENAP
ncbi:amino acid adenylation domain-containing protein [Archangium lansingense]|uniref:amino acid adenylation domain-containing protein n=1 Tax=Archangium lansingense TaxID=2995310 RepID=UPI003B7BE335